MGAVGDSNNTQLKQLENTVEQLKSHFVQLLQHLPLTTSQQQQYGNAAAIPNMAPISHLLSTPTSTSTPNVNPHSHAHSLSHSHARHLAAANNLNMYAQAQAQGGSQSNLQHTHPHMRGMSPTAFVGFNSMPQSAAYP